MSDTEEPMDCSDGSQPQPLVASPEDIPAKNQDEVNVTIAFEWSKKDPEAKLNRELEMALQSWANDNKAFVGDCKVLLVSADDTAVIKFKPAPALSDLQKLTEQPLGKRGVIFKILSVNLTPKELKIPTPEYASMKPSLSSMSGPQHEEELRSVVSTAGEKTQTLTKIPVNHFCYVNHIYKEEIKRIEREHGVKVTAEVIVTIQSDETNGDPSKACFDYTTLVQKSLGESSGSTIPLKNVNPEGWRDVLAIAQRKENKVLLTVSPEEMIVCGPKHDFIKESLAATTNNSNSDGASSWMSEDRSLEIGMRVNDPLVRAGLTMEEIYWKLMTTSFDDQVAKIKTKFGVDFLASSISQGKVEVKACYKASRGNVAMESHAVRALLRLYQKIATSPMSFTQHSRPPYMPSEGASGGSELNGQSGHKTEAPTGGEAKAGEDEEEICPICMDTFTNKKQLKCKHEFCEECLENSLKAMGPTCPVCKAVFGVMEGDQPDGKMSDRTVSSSLPGFTACGTIVIDYNIPSGIQTKKHPHPGRPYSGIYRTAYLPDNAEGREVLRLLTKAFNQKLIFTIGMSRTTGLDGQVTWNDIHHKTSMSGGSQSFGYPDDKYLSRVKDELKAKGIA